MRTSRWSLLCVLGLTVAAVANAAEDPMFGIPPKAAELQWQLTPVERNTLDLLANRPLLYLVVEDALIESLASVNPEAAMLMHILQVRSRTPEAVAPAIGHGGALALSNRVAVSVALRTDDEDELASVMTPLASGSHSRLTWEMTQSGSNPVLLIKHRILDSEHQVSDKPYPDIEVQLQPEPSNDHYRAVAWRCASVDASACPK
jgi:hypothetical protein